VRGAVLRGFDMAKPRDISADVLNIIRGRLQVEAEDVKTQSAFVDDLGANSLALVDMTLAFEEAFDLNIPYEDVERIRTVQDAIDYVEKNAKP
jgi:acyl carrier protein